MGASAQRLNPPEAAQLKRQDWLIIALVGAAHSCSHFFQLVIPTLYLSLAAEFGYDFAQLGLLASIFFLMSSIGQASSGFVVDRVGPTPVLWFGLGCFVASGVLISASNGYAMLALAAAVGGAGNSVFHPVDYSILNHRVSAARLGHGFSTHGLTGNLGWALAPVFMAAFIHLANWRVAAIAASALVAIVLLFTWWGRDLLSGNTDTLGRTNHEDAMSKDASASGSNGDLSQKGAMATLRALVMQPALWGAFLFFACTSISLSAIQNYTIPMLDTVYGVDKVIAGSALSGYMLAAALGMFAGGFVVSSTPRSEFTVFVSLVLAAAFFALLATGMVGSPVALVLIAMAGFFSGVAGPSRDMLIRRVTPKGATGTVYGLVYSGMDIGASLAPVAFGLMLDVGLTRGPWVGAAVSFVVAALLAMAVGRAAAARNAPSASMA